MFSIRIPSFFQSISYQLVVLDSQGVLPCAGGRRRRMKHFNWQILLGLFLIILSVFFYLIHYLIFRDAHHIMIYLIGDIAFVFVEVLLVTLIIHQLLDQREKRSKLHKLNMVIGTFFSEVGTDLMKFFIEFDAHIDKIRKNLLVTDQWPGRQLLEVNKSLMTYDFRIESERGDLEKLKRFLIGKRDFLLRLLENPNVLEHETFTDLLWAVFHLAEELENRADVKKLSETDSRHISGDMKRAYVLLVSQWLIYMKHLKTNYPYLFSLAVRINPFDPHASPIVQ